MSYMNRLLSTLTLITLFVSQLTPFFALAQATAELKDFKITAPTEVIVNEAFDVTVEAQDGAGKTLDKYEGTIFFDTNNNPADVVLPFEE